MSTSLQLPIAARGVLSSTALALALSACTHLPVTNTAIPRLRHQAPYVLPETRLLEVSDAMTAFVNRYVKAAIHPEKKAWALAHATLDPGVLNFEYDPLVTLTSAEAFAARKGNCLTFSSLFIAMAREAGLDAWYQEVEVQPEWNSVKETVLVTMHVNAVVRHRGSQYTIDISRTGQAPHADVRRISDAEAQAQYFNNLGADALVDSDLPRAYAYFRAAILTHPGLAYTWSNLGVVLKRNGQTEDARLAYLEALRLDSGQSTALNNLQIIYVEQGDFAAAEAIQARVEKNRRSNPYYLLHLARVANEENRHAEAIDLLERAIRLKTDDYRFHLALAESLYRSGQRELAQNSLDRAHRLLPSGVESVELTLPGAAPPGDSP
ncbi:MAG: tetratricopeptide repeat protein [Xanthomonadales bacterium]|nr:tetratricopeptide repeat protein [Xanthomonadales bacterium]